MPAEQGDPSGQSVELNWGFVSDWRVFYRNIDWWVIVVGGGGTREGESG